MNLDRLKACLMDPRSGEGRNLRPYLDTTGALTIGYGHNLAAKGISANVALVMLNEDIADALAFLGRALPWTLQLDDVRARVFVELAFEMDTRLLTFRKMLAAAQAGEWLVAYNELLDSSWSRQVQPARRDRLGSMLLTGEEL